MCCFSFILLLIDAGYMCMSCLFPATIKRSTPCLSFANGRKLSGWEQTFRILIFSLSLIGIDNFLLNHLASVFLPPLSRIKNLSLISELHVQWWKADDIRFGSMLSPHGVGASLHRKQAADSLIQIFSITNHAVTAENLAVESCEETKANFTAPT